MGHEIGDQLLQSVGLRLKQCLRQEDTMARLGGDEFVVFKEQADNVLETVHLAEKIIENHQPALRHRWT